MLRHFRLLMLDAAEALRYAGWRHFFIFRYAYCCCDAIRCCRCYAFRPDAVDAAAIFSIR